MANRYISKRNLNDVIRADKLNTIKATQTIVKENLTKEERFALFQKLYNERNGITEDAEYSKNQTISQSIIDTLSKIDLSKIKNLPRMSARGKAFLVAMGIAVGGISLTSQVIKGAKSVHKSDGIISELKNEPEPTTNEIPRVEVMESYQIMSGYVDVSDINDFDGYPGYRELLLTLKEKHPNWTFKPYVVDFDFETCVERELSNGAVAIQKNQWNAAWYPEYEKLIDGNTWVLPSNSAVACMMDTRNFLNENQIFQFESMKFSDKHNVNTIKSMFRNAGWANSDRFSYMTTEGTIVTMDCSFADIVYDAAEKYGVSATYLASKILMEQGNGDQAGKTGCGTIDGYKGLYNYGNINSYGAGDMIWKSGLNKAAEENWDTPQKSVDSLAEFIKEKYMNNGQINIYLTKYNFDDNGNPYHQYMTNFTGAYGEAGKLAKEYRNNDCMQSAYTFVIPVYKNMPEKLCAMPDYSAYIDEADINAQRVWEEKQLETVDVEQEKTVARATIELDRDD